MPELREYRRFGWRYMLINLLSTVPFVPVFIFICRRISAERTDFWFWIAITFFFVGAVFGLWWQERRARRMRCPQCHTLIIRSRQAAPNQPINFVCTRCEVEWVTGLAQSDD